MTAQWHYIILITSLLLAMVLLWMEYSRPLKRWLAWRMLAVLLVVISLTTLILPVTISGSSETPTQEAIITTEGTLPDSIRLFNRLAGKQLPQYTAHTLSQIPADVYNRVHVFGYGLTTTELQQLPAGLPLIPHLSAPTAITHIYWQQQLTQGQPLQVQGHYNNTGNAPVLLQLNGQHTRLDTLTIPAHTSSTFSLHALPVHIGKTVYELYTMSNGDTLAKEPVPLEVIPPSALSVLVLAAAPGFENRFVINWLSDNGYKVAARTAISKNKFQYSYANQARIPLEQLTASTLSSFDVVIGDIASFKNSSPSEQSAFREQVAGKGLGIILLADSSQLPALFTGASFDLQSPGISPQPVDIRLPNTAITTALPPAPLLYITPHPALQPLVYDAQQHLRVAASLYGAGHLVVNTLPATYSWQLSGHPQTYSAWWTTLLQQAIRPSFTGAQWQPLSFIPTVHTPVTLQLTTTDTTTAPVQVNESRVIPAQQPLLPFQWQAVYWPNYTGWQAITDAGNTVYWWYVYQPQQWAQVKATEKVQATLHYAHTNNNAAKASGVFQKNVETLPSWYAWLLLLLCCSFLWWESKTRYTGRKKR